MPKNQPGTVTIRDARILFRNFAGKEGQYNAEGERGFAVVLPDDIAQQMVEDGWNVKYLKPREEDESPTPYVQVAVSFKRRPPKVVMISWRGNPPERARVTLPEELVELLDFADLSKVDLILNPYVWGPIRGESGVKAYLKSIFAEIQRDELEFEYDDIPEIDMAGNPLQITAGGEPSGDEEEMIEGEVVEDDRTIES